MPYLTKYKNATHTVELQAKDCSRISRSERKFSRLSVHSVADKIMREPDSSSRQRDVSATIYTHH